MMAAPFSSRKPRNAAAIGQAFLAQVNHVPVAYQRQADHVEHHQLARFELEPEGVHRDEAHAQARHDRLLDGFVAAHFHGRAESRAMFPEHMLE
jgi:hypothetical protein